MCSTVLCIWALKCVWNLHIGVLNVLFLLTRVGGLITSGALCLYNNKNYLLNVNFMNPILHNTVT